MNRHILFVLNITYGLLFILPSSARVMGTYSEGAFRIQTATIPKSLPVASNDSRNLPVSIRGPLKILRAKSSGEYPAIASLSSAILYKDKQPTYLATAIADKNGFLHMIVWKAGRSGIVTRVTMRETDIKVAHEANLSVTATGRFIYVALVDESNYLKIVSFGWYSDSKSKNTGISLDYKGSSEKAAYVIGRRSPQIVEMLTMPNIYSTSSPFVITVTRSLNDFNMTVTSWRVSEYGAALHVDSVSAGPVSEVSFIQLDYPFDWYVSTSVRTRNGSLKVILWHLSHIGTLSRVADSGNAAGASWKISSVSKEGSLYTGVRTAEGVLKIMRWIPQYTIYTFDVLRVADTDGKAGEAQDISMVTQSMKKGITRITCGVRTAEGMLRLIRWTVNERGLFIRDGDSGDLGAEDRFSNVMLSDIKGEGDDRNWILAAGKTQDGNLKISAWKVDYS